MKPGDHIGLGWRRHRVVSDPPAGAAVRLDVMLGQAIEEFGRSRPMSKLQAVAERIAATKKRLDDEADKLAARMDAIDADAPKAFDRGHAFLDAQKADVEGIEATLRQLSNLPLSASDSG